MSVVNLLLFLSSITLYRHSPIDGYLDCSEFLALMNSVTQSYDKFIFYFFWSIDDVQYYIIIGIQCSFIIFKNCITFMKYWQNIYEILAKPNLSVEYHKMSHH